MIRLLHLFDASADWQHQVAVNQLRARLKAEEFSAHFATIDRDMTAYLDLGGERVTVLSRRLGLPVFAAPGIRSFGGAQGVDLVHAWGVDAAVAARSAFTGDKPIVVSVFDPGIGDRAVRILRTLDDGTKLAIACATERVRRRLVERGVRLEQCVVLRPGVDFAALRTVDRGEWRRRLGLAEDAIVFCTPPPLPGRDGHLAVLWAVFMRRYLDERVRLVIPGAGHEIARMRRLAEASECPEIAVFTGRRHPVEQLIAASDWLVMGDVDDRPMTAAAWALAASRPIVAPATYATSEILSHELNALLFKAPSEWRRRAARMCPLFADAPLLSKIREVGRGQAYQVFSVRRCVQQHARLYENLLAGHEAGAGITDPAVVSA